MLLVGEQVGEGGLGRQEVSGGFVVRRVPAQCGFGDGYVALRQLPRFEEPPGIGIGGGQLVGNAKVVAPQRIVRLVTVQQPAQNLLGAAETLQSRRNPSQVRFRHVALHFADAFVAQRHLARKVGIAARLARKVLEVLQRAPYQQLARRGRPRHAARWRRAVRRARSGPGCAPDRSGAGPAAPPTRWSRQRPESAPAPGRSAGRPHDAAGGTSLPGSAALPDARDRQPLQMAPYVRCEMLDGGVSLPGVLGERFSGDILQVPRQAALQPVRP